jgi:hypothetical protein
MERAGKLLRLSKLAASCLSPEQAALAAWPVAVGRKVARNSRAVSVVRGRLVVEVPDGIWQDQLRSLRHQILIRIAEDLGPEAVNDIDFRVVPPRRMPGREFLPVRGPLWETAYDQTGAGGDDADRIDDPVLSVIYKARRKRSTA